MRTKIPRAKYIGKRVGPPLADEAEHFFKCKLCGAWVDMRDLGDVFSHAASRRSGGAISGRKARVSVLLDNASGGLDLAPCSLIPLSRRAYPRFSLSCAVLVFKLCTARGLVSSILSKLAAIRS